MSVYRPGRAPSVVHSSLVHALGVADAASAHALLWFAEVLDRRLYRDRGFLSIEAYAEAELGFSTRKTEQFIQLARLVKRFRRLRESLIQGRLTWTQVRTIAPVLTAESEAHWVGRAEALSRRELAREIAAARTRVRAKVRTPDQVRLPAPDPAESAGPVPTAPTDSRSSSSATHPTDEYPEDSDSPSGPISRPDLAASAPGSHPPDDGDAPEVMTTVTLRLRPIDRARLERAVEALRRQGYREERGTLVVAAIEQMAATSGATSAPSPSDSPTHSDRSARPARQVVITVCPTCRHATTGVGASTRPVDPLTVETLLCDADVVDGSGHRRATIPPSIRRRVLARDGHQCSAPGCGSTHHLEIHHRVPVAPGGTNDPGNLVTLCHRCHRSLHEIARRRAHRGSSQINRLGTDPEVGPSTRTRVRVADRLPPGVPDAPPPKARGRLGRPREQGPTPDQEGRPPR